MFQKIPYARYTLVHKPSGRHILDVHEISLDVVLGRIQFLRQAGNDMSEYRIVKRIIRSQMKIDEGITQRTSFPP